MRPVGLLREILQRLAGHDLPIGLYSGADEIDQRLGLARSFDASAREADCARIHSGNPCQFSAQVIASIEESRA